MSITYKMLYFFQYIQSITTDSPKFQNPVQNMHFTQILLTILPSTESTHHSSRLQQADTRLQQDVTKVKSNYEASLINNFVSSGNASINQ